MAPAHCCAKTHYGAGSHVLRLVFAVGTLIVVCFAEMKTSKPSNVPPVPSMDVASVKAAAKKWIDTADKVVKPMLPLRDRQRGMIHFGERDRIRNAMLKLLKGEKFTVATVGGSITAGQGVADGGHSWPDWLFKWIKGMKPKGPVAFHNGAVPGTPSAYMSMCLKVHVPEDADIVFVEYALNDQAHPTPVFNNTDRISMELLIRKILRMKNKPALIMMNAFTYFTHVVDGSPTGSYWVNSEAEYLDFATYYGLSMISVKAASYRHMVAGTPGFKVHTYRLNHMNETKRGEVFYWDPIHPDGNTGARVMGELAFTFLTDAMHTLYRALPSGKEAAHLKAPLPRPMIPGNFESTTDACWIGPNFQKQAVIAAEGFRWINEAPKAPRPKWGYVAKHPGAIIRLKMVTRPNADLDSVQNVTVGVLHLRSYEHMGKAAVTCVAGCECEPSVLNGLQKEHNSQIFAHQILVTQADECIIQLEVLENTDSGEHKVKVIGVVVSELDKFDIPTPGSIDYVHDIAFRGDGKFDIRNHV